MVARNRHTEKTDCPLACALDILGDHWSLIVVRDLLFRNRHQFNELLLAEEGISTNILTDRLRRLNEAGLVDSIRHPQSSRSKLYYLTNSGKQLIHTIMELTLWSGGWLNSQVSIPATIQDSINEDLDAFKQGVLAKLSLWEASMKIDAR